MDAIAAGLEHCTVGIVQRHARDFRYSIIGDLNSLLVKTPLVFALLWRHFA
jgi:hypothetical protein